MSALDRFERRWLVRTVVFALAHVLVYGSAIAFFEAEKRRASAMYETHRTALQFIIAGGESEK